MRAAFLWEAYAHRHGCGDSYLVSLVTEEPTGFCLRWSDDKRMVEEKINIIGDNSVNTAVAPSNRKGK